MTSFYFIFFLLISAPFALLADLVDLDAKQQDFVIEAKQIHIPGYPHAFNPSLIRYQDRLLLSFRFISNPKFSFVSYIGLQWLDEDYNPEGEPQILSLRDPASEVPSRIDDARLVQVGEKLYIVYSDNPYPVIKRGGFRLYVGELVSEEGMFTVKDIDCLSKFPGEDPDRREKNWAPFDYNGSLRLAYSLKPHCIFQPYLGEGRCEEVCSTASESYWRWGMLRGGTPGVISEGEYLSFFHSSMDMPTVHSSGKAISHYFMGAYTFSANPPFPITKISPEPIYCRGFYEGASYKPYWKPVKVVYPCGFVSNDQFIWVAYGRDDHECWVVKLHKEGLLQSLIPVNSH